MAVSGLISLIVFLPLLAAVLVGLFVRVMPVRLSQALTCGGIILSALFSWVVFSHFTALAHDPTAAPLVYKVQLLPWIASGDFIAGWALRVDSLTAVMLVVVTTVSAIVHLYSTGYMSHDPHQQRFMAYLSLFTFCMLMLVTADNFAQLFFGWEGVGLSSYLLIGFWFQKPAPNAAAMKAFIVNRVGDFGFALGIFACFVLFGSIEFDAVFSQAASKSGNSLEFLGYQFHALTLVCLLLFVGAMGKSAQLLLHTWLPDAMEGPTPVSALIHAATMVTAGVFMVARCSPLFDHAPDALLVVTAVGALTAFFAATVGLVQNDIKRVIAYSTCSQLGYMFFACGVGAYAAAIFHLMTHAFFKALLFLGAGSVIHGMSGEQDMRRMGGIWKLMPYTYAYMWIGSLALAGVPFFAGFYSKDIILESAFAAGGLGRVAYVLGCAAAFMTAFYSWRLLFMTFHGKPRASHEVMHHVHESPRNMLLPLVVLALGAVFSGYVGVHCWRMVSGEAGFWQASIASHEVIEKAHHVPLMVKLLPLFAGISGIALAWLFYVKSPSLPSALASSMRPLYLFLLNKWYFDELYEKIFVRGARRLGRIFWKVGDEEIIDGMGPNGVALVSQIASARASRFQTGFVYHYAFAMLIGLLVLISWVVFRG